MGLYCEYNDMYYVVITYGMHQNKGTETATPMKYKRASGVCIDGCRRNSIICLFELLTMREQNRIVRANGPSLLVVADQFRDKFQKPAPTSKNLLKSR